MMFAVVEATVSLTVSFKLITFDICIYLMFYYYHENSLLSLSKSEK